MVALLTLVNNLIVNRPRGLDVFLLAYLGLVGGERARAIGVGDFLVGVDVVRVGWEGPVVQVLRRRVRLGLGSLGWSLDRVLGYLVLVRVRDLVRGRSDGHGGVIVILTSSRT